MYMLDDSDDDDLEDFPASRKAGMHMATDRKPNGEWRDGMDEANGEQQQKRKFVDDGVESGSNTGDDRMEMGARELDNKGGNSMAADIKESGKRNWLSEDFRRVSLSKLRQSRIARDLSVKIGKTGQRK
jgi:hypothetical protein